MRKYIAIFSIFIFVFLSGCAPSVVKIGDSDNGREIALNKNQTLLVSLKGNPTTGYIWQAESLDQDFLKQEGDSIFKAQSNLIGAPGVETFKFTALKSGKTELKMIYRRPWEEITKPEKVFSVNVNIR